MALSGLRLLILRSAAAVLAVAGTGFADPAAADPLPTRVGQCTQTTIARIGFRLSDATTGRSDPSSGSAVNFANGGYQVSYDTVPPIAHSRAGDPVSMCLVSIPEGCPPGDNRGREYKTTNLRTRESWTLPDSEHSCGGA
ncbi:MAG: hypothetical protein JO305_07220 [Alphaproteobacteria bacterium]|nr:hypothetical protein [Alphaproteobacteria bacterium]